MGDGVSGEEKTALNFNKDDPQLIESTRYIDQGTTFTENLQEPGTNKPETDFDKRKNEADVQGMDARGHLQAMEDRHQQPVQSKRNENAVEKKRSEETFQREKARITEEIEANRIQYQKRIKDLEQATAAIENHVAELIAELAKPVKEKQAKIDFINGLNLVIRQNESLYLVGPKGTGKSTFMWLLNKGERPVQSFGDGTVQILQLDGYVDSIGLRGWTPEELLKLLVLMIYDGIPKDLIIFGNDRIDLPITSLGWLGIKNPLIVIMSSDFWKHYAKKRIHLTESRDGVRRVQPEEDLDMVYNLSAYEDIKEFGRGTPITHHDDIQALVDTRTAAGVRPFQFLRETLGNQLTINMENNNFIEMLFRFIYVYEKMYNQDRLRFMNRATLQDFSTLA